jgi:hypothetical protein
MNHHTPNCLRRPTPAWVNVAIAIGAGILLGTALFLGASA